MDIWVVWVVYAILFPPCFSTRLWAQGQGCVSILCPQPWSPVPRAMSHWILSVNWTWFVDKMWPLPVKTYKPIMEAATNINQLFRGNTFLHSFSKHIYFREERRHACESLKRGRQWNVVWRKFRRGTAETLKASGACAEKLKGVLVVKEQTHGLRGWEGLDVGRPWWANSTLSNRGKAADAEVEREGISRFRRKVTQVAEAARGLCG